MRPTLLCFAGDVWDGNPHSRHHLATRFAAEFDVLFIEGVPMRSVAYGDRHELRRIVGKLRSRAKLRMVREGLHVLRPLPVPPAGPVGRRLQLAALRHAVLGACRELRLDGPRISWFSVPVAAPLRGKLGDRASVFYYQDRYDAFSHVDAAALQRHVADLARGCDLSIATADSLAADLREHGAEPLVVPHAVDVDRFAGTFPMPSDLADLEPPLIGCVGLIDDYLSFDALRAVADSLDQGTVVMVGGFNVDPSTLEHPRIALLGRKPYADIPAYVAHFRTCLIPFALNRLTVGVNPIKLREYLAAGRPVVSTALPEVEPYGDVVRLVREPGDFVAAVRESLAPDVDDEAARARRRARVSGESWDDAAATIAARMHQLVAQSGSVALSAVATR